ncbi:GntR family transcriptional regulator [Streptomyces sp. NPDC016309]|uniref:GntR family transcriptional regulator n=1 Tax=Streptomyces sp. NPDC016309 TaxID=3364965 RepID=UPI0037018906
MTPTARIPLSLRHGADDPHALRLRIHETLLIEIVDGTLPPGTGLDETHTAQRLQVPKARVREALIMLAAQRLVEYTGPDAARVTSIDSAASRHTATVLHGLYRTALTTTSWPLAEDHLQALRNCATAHTRAATRNEIADALAGELALWDTFVLACANRPLYDAVTHLTPVWQRAHRLHMPPTTVHEADWDTLLTACTTGDRHQALHHLDKHWTRVDHHLAPTVT